MIGENLNLYRNRITRKENANLKNAWKNKISLLNSRNLKKYN